MPVSGLIYSCSLEALRFDPNKLARKGDHEALAFNPSAVVHLMYSSMRTRILGCPFCLVLDVLQGCLFSHSRPLESPKKLLQNPDFSWKVSYPEWCQLSCRKLFIY
jgi:hypothetical protein